MIQWSQKEREPMADIRDIAKMAGVSTATVSKVLNNYKEVSDATKVRILKIVADVGYIPNSNARALSTKRSWLIGIVYSECLNIGLEHNYFSGLLEAFKREAEALGYEVVFISGYGIGYLKRCQVRNVDGVFVVAADVSDPGLQALFDSDIKCVTTDVPYKSVPLIYSDNKQGSRLAISHLYDLGHRRIAHIAGPASSVAGKERMEGYLHGLRDHNLEYDPALVVEASDFGGNAGYEAMNKLFLLNEIPSAVFVLCDLVAVGVMHSITEHGLEVGKDISIVGFDDIELARHIHPALTTIKQDRKLIGKILAETLIKRINRQPVDEITMIQTELIIRNSTSRFKEK
jgi:DNA-binding LacI/PurR family transcriptional regulator